MSEEPSRRQQAAAFHGLATNPTVPPAERLQLALQALDLYEQELGDVDSVELEAVGFGLTAQQEIRARALAAAMNWVGDPCLTTDDALNVARRFAAWVEYGDIAEEPA